MLMLFLGRILGSLAKTLQYDCCIVTTENYQLKLQNNLHGIKNAYITGDCISWEVISTFLETANSLFCFQFCKFQQKKQPIFSYLSYPIAHYKLPAFNNYGRYQAQQDRKKIESVLLKEILLFLQLLLMSLSEIQSICFFCSIIKDNVLMRLSPLVLNFASCCSVQGDAAPIILGTIWLFDIFLYACYTLTEIYKCSNIVADLLYI